MKTKYLGIPCLLIALMLGNQPSVYAGGNIGSGDIDDVLSSVCAHEAEFYDCIDHVSRELTRAQARAATYAERGEFAKSRGALKNGLSRALGILKSWRYSYYPLTLDALKRGIELERQFYGFCKNANSDACTTENRRASRFISAYIEYIRRRIFPLDLDYRVPSYFGRSRYRDFDWWNAYIIAYRDAAMELLDLYMGRQGTGLPESFGQDAYETRVAEKVFQYVADDLSQDDYRRFFRFEYMDLRDAQETLHIWNAEKIGFTYGGRDASMYARAIAGEVRDRIQEASCYVNETTIDYYYRRHSHHHRDDRYDDGYDDRGWN